MKPDRGDDTTTARPEIAVIIVTHNSAATVPALLGSLRGALAALAGSSQVVVCDNDSSDGSPELVATLAPDVQVLRSGSNLGYAAAINLAARAVTPTRAYLVLNPDLRLEPGMVPSLLAELDRSGVGMAVPRLFDGEGRVCLSLRREPTVLRAFGEAVLGGHRAGRFSPFGEIVEDPLRYSRRGPADWATGAAILVSVACWADVGPWNERYFLYSEEVDFALRARDAGYSLMFVPEAEAVHLGGEAHTSPSLYGLLTRNRLRLYAARHRRPATAAYWTALCLGEATRAVAGRPIHRAGLRALTRRRVAMPT